MLKQRSFYLHILALGLEIAKSAESCLAYRKRPFTLKNNVYVNPCSYMANRILVDMHKGEDIIQSQDFGCVPRIFLALQK